MKMNKFFSSSVFLFFCVALAACLRLWNLGSLPPALSPDEASLGYNSYSILKTGRDEYGKFMPIIFKSFGDYKPGLYVYASVPFVAILGLTEWAVRLPSALSGVLIVILVYKIILHLTSTFNKDRWLISNGQLLANLSAFCAAVSPWLIFFSRGAWEANVALTLTLAGIYFFLVGFKYPLYFLLSSLHFALTLLTYQGAKLSTLIVIFVLMAVFWRDFWKLARNQAKTITASSILFLLIASPAITSFFQGETGRLKVFSVFSYPRPKEYLDDFLNQAKVGREDLNYYFYYSEALNLTRGVMGRWFNHFSGRFLFFEGDYQNPRHSSPNHGMLLLTDLLFLPLGIIFLLKAKSKKLATFILLWLVLSPFPAALSRDQVQSVRALNLAIPLIIISSFGLCRILDWIKTKNLVFPYYILLTTYYLLPFVYFLDSYFTHYSIHNAKYLSYGYKEAVKTVLDTKDNYGRIVFQQSYAQPYIYFLFYGNWDSGRYQGQAKLSSGGVDVGLVDRLDNIEFVNFSWPYATGEKSTLIIGNEIVVPKDFSLSHYNLISEIKYPDGFSAAFRIVETK